jgi:hypothetical protein
MKQHRPINPAWLLQAAIYAHRLAEKRPILGEAQMMRIGWGAAANQTGLLDNEPHVFSVADSPRFGMS